MKNTSNNKWSILLITSLAIFQMPVMLMGVNVALPSIGREFMLDSVILGWISMAPAMTSAMLVIPAGKISDIYGRKKVFLYGMIACTATSLFVALSDSMLSLIIWRFGQGIGAAMVIASITAIVSSVFSSEEKGKALGISAAAVYAGQSCSPFIGGLLTEYFGWRSIFIATVPTGIIVIIFIFWKFKGEWAEAHGDKIDFIGVLIYAVTLFMAIYGFSSLTDTLGIWAAILGVVGVLAFIKWESYVKNPILDLNLFKKSRTFTISNLAAFINYSAVHAVAFLLSLYLQYNKGLSPQDAGLILISQPIIQALFSPLAGRLADRSEPRIVSSIGMALTTVGLLFFVFLTKDTSLIYILFGLFMVGSGLSIFVTPNTKAIMESVDKRYYGVASATMATSRQVGMLFSMAITMLVFSLIIGRVEVTPEYFDAFLKSMKTIFSIFVLLGILAVFASLSRGKTRIKP